MQNIIIDEQLRLAPLRDVHAPGLFTLIEENRSYLRQWLPWLDANTTQDHVTAFTRDAHKRNADFRGMVQAILVEDQIAGVCGYNFIDQTNRWGELGYWLAASHQGKGIVTRCAQVQVAYAERNLNVHRTSISVATENTGSRAIAERLNFHFEGILRDCEWLYDHYVDHAVYARLSTDPL